ncbi:hypothetical protein [Yeosuana marina]|uniref:hypothetical protein n=1 Tax=Yeosuana marina TaxID=1565536 RepID=UPI00141D7FA4|nr:hypothetical protein [Yeosuana marina]
MDTKNLKYIIKTFVFILLITLLVDKIVFFVLNTISDQVFTGQSIGKLNHFLKIKDDVDFIVFGSSRANHNIDPLMISQNSFNMGMDGRKIAYPATLIKLLPKEKKQIILLQIDTENAFSENYTGVDIQALNSKYNRNKIIKNEIDKLGQNNIIQNFYWSLSYNSSVLGILKNYFKPNYNYKTYFGYDPIYVNENQRKIFKNILSDEISEKCQQRLAINKIYNSYLDELKLFCEENNKTIIFFTSPKFNDTCKNDNDKLSEIMKTKKLIYYDLTDYFKGNNLLGYWKDKDHLSKEGAELFTQSIKKKLTNHILGKEYTFH